MANLFKGTIELIGTLIGTYPPRVQPFRPNRVDSTPNLIKYHDPSNGPKPRPQETTELLPLRTLVGFLSPLDDFSMEQTNAHYEEIDTIPAAAVEQKSEFKTMTHWYLIHPLQPTQVRALSSRVLEDLKLWIQDSEDKYIGTCKLVRGFQDVRTETLEGIQKELRRRGMEGQVGDEEGYLGKWEEVDEDGQLIEKEEMTLSGSRNGLIMEWLSSTNGSTTLTAEGLAAADEMAMCMVEEARKMEEAMEWDEVEHEDAMDAMEYEDAVEYPEANCSGEF
ncbi:hypothetical protein DM02DRAFT_611623 [Periconia macrospinosa]|uniref:Uncharacterized protein n=1 Tax=Periconia macrospinosa TaxID=97972 RepID=A0A2V1E547_9PLEO|nr:hypothetical protein DM02DRAFT_611623 [Periconia macrospinosa]